MPKGVLGQMDSKPTIARFSAHGGLVSQNIAVQKLWNFEEKPLGRPDFPPKSAPSTGELRIGVFPPFLQVSAKGPKWAKTPPNRYSRPVGLRPKKNSFPKSLRKTILDSAVTFLFRSGTPCAVGLARGPACGSSLLLLVG